MNRVPAFACKQERERERVLHLCNGCRIRTSQQGQEATHYVSASERVQLNSSCLDRHIIRQVCCGGHNMPQGAYAR